MYKTTVQQKKDNEWDYHVTLNERR